MPKTVLDLRLHQVAEVDEQIIDRNGVPWSIYAGTPATMFAHMVAIQEAWPKDEAGHMLDDPDPDALPADIATRIQQAIWDNLRHANPGRTFEQLQDGILLEDSLGLLNFLSQRSQLRLEEMKAKVRAQTQDAAPTATRPSTSRPKRRASAAKSKAAS